MSGTSQRLVPALFDGDRLRQARLYRGWRKVEVANAVDISPAAVGQYESGKARPSAGARVTRAAPRFPSAFFERRSTCSEGRTLRIAEDAAHFRKLRSTTKIERDRLLVRLELLAELLAEVETYVQLPDVDVPVRTVGEEAPETEPERAAAEVRGCMGSRSRPHRQRRAPARSEGCGRRSPPRRKRRSRRVLDLARSTAGGGAEQQQGRCGTREVRRAT